MSPEKEVTVSFVLPCLNEGAAIAECVRRARAELDKTGLPFEIIVSDNGSSDGSPELSRSAGARITNCCKRGYGHAVHEGVLSARGRYVIFADADLSYPFNELKNLLTPLQNGTSDLMLGRRLNARMERGAMPFLHRYLGTPFLSFLIRSFTGLKIRDCNSGLRAFRRADYAKLKLKGGGMEYASAMLMAAAREGWRVGETDIAFCKDRRGRKPHLRPLRDGARHLAVIFKMLIFPLKKG